MFDWVDRKSITQSMSIRIKNKFEVSPKVLTLERGTVAREFESSVKAPRFLDKRE